MVQMNHTYKRLNQLVWTDLDDPTNRTPFWDNVLEKEHPEFFRDRDVSINCSLNLNAYFMWLGEEPQPHFDNVKRAGDYFNTTQNYVKLKSKDGENLDFAELEAVIRKIERRKGFVGRRDVEGTVKVLRNYLMDNAGLLEYDQMNPDQLMFAAQCEGHGKRAPGYTDNIFLCLPENLLTLLETGGKAKQLNKSQGENTSYIHRVMFGGHIFQAITPAIYRPFEKFTEVKNVRG